MRKLHSFAPAIGRTLIASTLLAAIAACGGSKNEPTAGTPGGGPTPGAGASAASNALANQCATNNEYAKTPGTGTLETEKAWTRAYMQEQYLWYSQMGTPDAAAAPYNLASGYESLSNWFSSLLTTATTPSGKRLDQYSFIYPTTLWNQRIQAGVSVGYGFELAIVSATVPRDLRVAYVEAGSPAAQAGFARGDSIREIVSNGNAVSIDANDDAGRAALNAALSPQKEGQTVTFRVQTRDGVAKDLNVTSAQVASSPMYRAGSFDRADAGPIGYVVFNEFAQLGEGQLVSAFTQLQQRGATDLVLDLRYNSGGYLYMASQLAYMIAGASHTAGKTFETIEFNDKLTPTIPVSERATPFYTQASGMEGTNTTLNAALPTLNLPRVFVLTSSSTCSASESVINSLRGIDIAVTLIGDTTCGKPYGFQAKDNCGISYFPIQFKGVNAKGFGDFADGFAPNVLLADDLTHELGDPSEAMLNMALSCVQGLANCTTSGATSMSKKSTGQPFPHIAMPPWRSAKLLR